MKNCKAIVLSLLSVFATSTAFAGLTNVITVPWEGDVTKFHTAISGQPVTLKGVLYASNATTSVSYQWNPGDGSLFSTLTSVSVVPGTPTPVSLNHTYTGSAGTPFEAWLIANDGTTTISNRYLVMLLASNLDTTVNIGIDDGLWWLYQNAIFTDGVHGNYGTLDGTPAAAWLGYYNEVHATSTASAVQAFEINGSLAGGDWTKDPYTQVVAYGLNYLLKGYFVSSSYPLLRAVTITSGGTTSEGNPDQNNNGIGIEVFDGYYVYYPIYQGGGVVDALVASGTPNASTGREFVPGHVATYQEVVQDMIDQYSWGQYTGTENYTIQQLADFSTLGTPDSLTFLLTDGTYYPANVPGNYTFIVNGTALSTNAETDEHGSENCYPGIHNVTISGAALATAWAAASPPTIEVKYSGGGYVSEVDWVLTYGTTNYTNAIYHTSGHNTPGYICDANTSSPFDISQTLSGTMTLSYTSSGIVGGWRYNWGNFPDNSTSQWAAIAALPAKQSPWNCTVPQYVSDYDNNWLYYSYADQNATWGKFGYTSSASLGYPYPPSSSTTPSGLVQLNNIGIPSSDYRWQKCEAYFQNNWDVGEAFLNYGLVNFYSLYSFTKAHRTAVPSPIVDFPNGFDWYRGDASHTGLAGAVSTSLINNGGAWPTTYWEGQELATAWAVIVLNPNLFSAGPVACFSANPNPGFANVPISFDPSCSTDPQPGGIANLTLFDWSWGDGSPDTITSTPDVVPHAFPCVTLPCSYQVTLTVYDNSNPALSASAQQTIAITQPPHPPVSVPGGPYIVSLCPGDTLTLIGSNSYSPDQGLKQNNCNTCPPDQLTAYGWALKGAPYIYTDSTDTNVDLGTGFTTYFPVANTYNIGLQVVDNAAHSFPAGASADLTNDAFTSVTVYNSGPCAVTATPGCESVTVSWNDVGGTSYIVLSSTNGPNSGFTQAATVGPGVTTTTIAATLGEVQWIRVEAVDANGGVTMSGAVMVTNSFQDCLCIEALTIQTKPTLVELDWPLVAGATSYNVYRSTGAVFQMIPQLRVATGVGTGAHGVWVDGDLINGHTYYYKISAVVNGVETCSSIEVHGTPGGNR